MLSCINILLQVIEYPSKISLRNRNLSHIWKSSKVGKQGFSYLKMPKTKAVFCFLFSVSWMLALHLGLVTLLSQEAPLGRQSVSQSVQSFSRVRLFATSWIAAGQVSLSITNSRSSLKLTSIESVMPSSHLILCRPPSPPAPNPSQHQSLFQWVNSLHEVAKVLEFQL